MIYVYLNFVVILQIFCMMCYNLGVENLVESGDFKDALKKWNYKHIGGFRIFRDQLLSQSLNNNLNMQSVLMAARIAKEGGSSSSFWDQVTYNVKRMFKEQVTLDLISTMIYTHFATIVKRMGVRYVPKVVNYKEKYIKLLQETNECIKILIPNGTSVHAIDDIAMENDDLDVTIDDIVDLKSPIDDEIMGNLTHSEQIIQYQQDIQKLTSQIEALTNDLKHKELELNNAKNEALNSRENIFSIREESISAREEATQVKQELKIAKEECSRLKQQLIIKNNNDETNAWEITSLKTQIEIKTTQLDKALVDNDKYCKMIANLNAQLDEYKDTLDIVNSELQMTKELLLEKTKKLEQSTGDIEELQGKIELSQSKNVINEHDIVKTREMEEKIQNLELINRDLQCEITLLEQEASGWKNAACELDIEKTLLSKQLAEKKMKENEKNVNRAQVCTKITSKRCIGVVPKLAAVRSANNVFKSALSHMETSDSFIGIKSGEENFRRISTTSTDDIWIYD